jgi:predicted amidohydrolase YtcJ
MSVLPGGRETLGHVNQDVTSETDPAHPAAPPTLYTGIVLYSTEDPEASAMLVADGLIAWTGPEDTGRLLHDDAATVDATGCLLTPGFVDAAATADGAAPDPADETAAAARGIVLRLPGPTGERDGMRIIAPVTESADYLDLVADGTPLAFGSAGAPEAADPWDWVRGAARTSPADQRISDRAAFLAATRGGQRAAGHRHPGSLRTGLPATFVVWEPWDLTVQSKAERVDSWSTDPRSRTPLLPDLDQGTPRALRTVVEGRILHDRLEEAPRGQARE